MIVPLPKICVVIADNLEMALAYSMTLTNGHWPNYEVKKSDMSGRKCVVPVWDYFEFNSESSTRERCKLLDVEPELKLAQYNDAAWNWFWSVHHPERDSGHVGYPDIHNIMTVLLTTSVLTGIGGKVIQLLETFNDMPEEQYDSWKIGSNEYSHRSSNRYADNWGNLSQQGVGESIFHSKEGASKSYWWSTYWASDQETD